MTLRDNNHQDNPRPECPHCQSQYVKREGYNTAGQQRYGCKKCGKQFVPPRVVTETTRKGKSGVIASKVTIGRGFKWGAGLV